VDDADWMSLALQQAELAQAQGEVPVGAVLVGPDGLIAQSFNQPIRRKDPTAHAEINCLRDAGQILNNYRLPGTTLYVTLEPCAMCAGAMIQARLSRLVYAAPEHRSGAIDTVMQILNHPALNHHVEVRSGLMAEHSAQLLRDFFKARR